MPNAALSDMEVEHLRFLMGYGNLGPMSVPYSPDGFRELFSLVVRPNLSTANETSLVVAVEAGPAEGMQLIDVAGIAPGTRLSVDVGEDAEDTVARVVTGVWVTVRLAKPHPLGCTVAIDSGIQRLRRAMHAAQRAYDLTTTADISQIAGIEQVVGDVRYFSTSATRQERWRQFISIIDGISALIRVPHKWSGIAAAGAPSAVEVY